MLEIRPAREDDLAAVIALERATEHAPQWADEEYRTMTQPRPDAATSGAVRRCLLVAVAGGVVEGFAVAKVVGCGTDGDVDAEIESVAVAAQVRRQGRGSALCEALLGWCRGEGAQAVGLEVRAASAGAIRLYEALGFVAIGRRAGYYRGPVEDALQMRCEVSSALPGARSSTSLHV